MKKNVVDTLNGTVVGQRQRPLRFAALACAGMASTADAHVKCAGLILVRNIWVKPYIMVYEEVSVADFNRIYTIGAL